MIWIQIPVPSLVPSSVDLVKRLNVLFFYRMQTILVLPAYGHCEEEQKVASIYGASMCAGCWSAHAQ